MTRSFTEPKPAYWLVVDFEATCCDQGSVPREQMEIIEFGAVMVDSSNLQIVSEFQSFIRPRRHPRLTPFCTQLTSITQDMVDGAPDFPTCAQAVKKWAQGFPDYVFCSWGEYDRKQLQQDCNYHKIPSPLKAKHWNVKQAMADKWHIRPQGLGQAVKMAGLRFTGVAHRGIDDARNIARLLPFIVGDERLPGH